jgi:hypothetical protein
LNKDREEKRPDLKVVEVDIEKVLLHFDIDKDLLHREVQV